MSSKTDSGRVGRRHNGYDKDKDKDKDNDSKEEHDSYRSLDDVWKQLGKISLDAVAGHGGGDAERPLGAAALAFAADQKSNESVAPLWKQAEEDQWVITDVILYREPPPGC